MEEYVSPSLIASDDRIRDGLREAVALGEVGVQVAAYLGDQLIVDDWIGRADNDGNRAVDSSTLFCAFSVSKALVATSVHLMAERGFVDIDAPVATYWPEYGGHGKSEITIRHVMTHRAGVPQVAATLSRDNISEWDEIVGYLAEVEPLCSPGTRSMYHTLSYGYILAEIVRRTDPRRRSFSDFVRDELCAPLGIEDVWMGLPPEHEDRLARLTGVSPAPTNRIRSLSLGQISIAPSMFNLPALYKACIPAAGGIMTARAGARFFSALACGDEQTSGGLLSKGRLMQMTKPRDNSHEIDEALVMPLQLGIGGYWIGGSHPLIAPCAGLGEHVLCHPGSGGAIGWADLDTGLSVMINHNRLFELKPNDRHPFAALANAVRGVADDHKA